MKDGLNEVSVIITDNDRYYVALKYDLVKGGTPKVVGKGDDVTLGNGHKYTKYRDIDQFVSPFLACMLHISTEVNKKISRDHFYPVAEVFAFIVNSRCARDYHLKKPNPDEFILQNMGLSIKEDAFH